MFGGEGYDFNGHLGALNDLWKLGTSGAWTFEGGSQNLPAGVSVVAGQYGTQAAPAPGNAPPGRANATAWVDTSGNLWLFGGTATNLWATGASGGGSPYPTASTVYQDLWEFKPQANTWIWISGAQGPASNSPPARTGAAGWATGSADFYFFGGDGITQPGLGPFLLGDFWRGTGVVY
jgi:hypothetical protein